MEPFIKFIAEIPIQGQPRDLAARRMRYRGTARSSRCSCRCSFSSAASGQHRAHGVCVVEGHARILAFLFDVFVEFTTPNLFKGKEPYRDTVPYRDMVPYHVMVLLSAELFSCSQQSVTLYFILALQTF